MDIVIKNEDDAWAWLKRALDNDLPEDEPIHLKFEGWPSLDLKFKGQDFNQSVPTRIMPPLLEAQREIHRVYSSLRYGSTSTRNLKEDERVALELNVKVKKGSSEYETNLSEILTRTFESAVDKMEPQQVLIAILSASVIWGGSVMWKNWLANRQAETNARLAAENEQREIEARVHMSKQETERLKVIAGAFQQVPITRAYSDGADDFRNDSLHKLKDADLFSIPNSDVAVDGKTAAAITTKPREQSIEARIDDQFVIQSVASGETDGFKLKVKRVSDGMLINVTIPDGTLDQDQRQLLQQNEWAKLPVLMELNVRILRGEITAARLVKASKIERRANPPPTPAQ